MPEIYASPFYEVTHDTSADVVRVRRTSEPFGATVHVRAEVDRLLSALPARAGGVIIDMRDAPPRNDPEFEAAMRHLRFTLGQRFARKVVLVRTASGQMQVNRLHRTEQADYRVTLDPDEALALAQAPLAPSSD
jgi:hypothetical protein